MGQTADGARVAGKLAQVLSEAMAHHEEAHADARSERGKKHVEGVMEHLERELLPILSPFLKDIAPELGDHPHAQEVLGWITDPDHFVQLVPIMMAIYPIVVGYVQAIVSPSVQNVANIAWTADPSLGLSAEAAAGAVIRGWISEAQGARIANSKGVGVDAFKTMCNTGRLPPGPSQVLEGWNRGFLGQGEVQKAIIESDIGSQWAPFFMKLRYAAMSPALAVEAAVQSHLDMGEAQRRYAMGGADPADFDVAYQTAGSPPGVEQMIALMNRGALTEAQVVQGIAESRMKTKYTPAVLQLKERLLPLDSCRQLVRSGAMTKDEAVGQLVKQGYNPTIAAQAIDAVAGGKVEAAKDLSAATIIDLYEAHMIDRATAVSDLGSLKYDEHEAGLLLALADHRAADKVLNHTVTVIKTAYTHKRIDEADARARLQNAGVPADAQAVLIAEWKLNMAERVRTLSEAQIVAATKKGVLDVQTAFTRLTDLGYSEEDSTILLATAGLIDLTAGS